MTRKPLPEFETIGVAERAGQDCRATPAGDS